METDKRNFIYQLANDQISSIKQEYERPGWTLWALLIALANCIWIFITELEKFVSSINYVEVLTFIFGGFFLFIFSISTLKLITDRNHHDLQDRYRYTNIFSNSRITIAFHIFIYICLFIATKYVHLLDILNIIIRVYFILIIVVFVFSLIFLSFSLPIKINSNSNLSQKLITLFALCLFPLFFSIIFYSQIDFKSPSFFLSVKISTLLLLIAFMLEKLTHYLTKNPILEELEKIRHDLSFNIIPAEEGLERIEMAVDGLRLKHLFSEDIAIILNNMHSFTANIEEARRNIDFLRSRYNELKPQNKTPDELRSDPIISGLLKNIKTVISNLKVITQDTQKKKLKVDTKIASIFRQAINKNEILDLKRNIDATIEKGTQSINDFDREISDFFKILDGNNLKSIEDKTS